MIRTLSKFLDALAEKAKKDRRYDWAALGGIVLCAFLIAVGLLLLGEALRGPVQQSRRLVSLAEVQVNTAVAHAPHKTPHVLCYKDGEILPKDVWVSDFFGQTLLAVAGSKHRMERTEQSGAEIMLSSVPASWLGCEEGESAVIYKFNPFE